MSEITNVVKAGDPELSDALRLLANTPALVTANKTAVKGDYLLCDTSAGAFTLTLPLTPSAGTIVRVIGNGWSTNNLTVARNGQTIETVADDLLCTFDSELSFLFIGGTWRY
jgi:hypothetical protein